MAGETQGQKFASFATSDMKEGTNLWDNADAVITGARFTAEAPDGYTTEGAMPLFAVLLFELPGTTPIEERSVSQSYSLGASAAEQFTVDPSGAGLIPLADDSSVRKDSKFGTLMGSMTSLGVPESIAKSGDITKLVGINAHWKRVADKERNFTSDRPGGKKSKFPPSTLVMVKLISLPSGVPVSAPTPGTAPTAGNGAAGHASAAPVPVPGTAAPTPTAPTADFDLDTVTLETIQAILTTKDGKVQRSGLTLLVAQRMMKDPLYSAHRQDIARRATDEPFLMQLTELGMLKYDPSAKPQMVYSA